MGLFTQKPEEPTEWAGLPSEPVKGHDTDLEQGADVITEVGIDPSLGNVSSVSIDLTAFATSVDEDATQDDPDAA